MQTFVNSFPRSAEYISLYIDQKLRRSLSSATDALTDATLNEILQIFRCGDPPFPPCLQPEPGPWLSNGAAHRSTAKGRLQPHSEACSTFAHRRCLAVHGRACSLPAPVACWLRQHNLEPAQPAPHPGLVCGAASWMAGATPLSPTPPTDVPMWRGKCVHSLPRHPVHKEGTLVHTGADSSHLCAGTCRTRTCSRGTTSST